MLSQEYSRRQTAYGSGLGLPLFSRRAFIKLQNIGRRSGNIVNIGTTQSGSIIRPCFRVCVRALARSLFVVSHVFRFIAKITSTWHRNYLLTKLLVVLFMEIGRHGTDEAGRGQEANGSSSDHRIWPNTTYRRCCWKWTTTTATTKTVTRRTEKRSKKKRPILKQNFIKCKFRLVVFTKKKHGHGGRVMFLPLADSIRTHVRVDEGDIHSEMGSRACAWVSVMVAVAVAVLSSLLLLFFSCWFCCCCCFCHHCRVYAAGAVLSAL